MSRAAAALKTSIEQLTKLTTLAGASKIETQSPMPTSRSLRASGTSGK